MSKHNESEWFAVDLRTDGRNPGIDITAADGAHICLVHHELGGSFAETMANARLIVAAQKMLAALQAVHDSVRGKRDPLQAIPLRTPGWDGYYCEPIHRDEMESIIDAIEAATGVRP